MKFCDYRDDIFEFFKNSGVNIEPYPTVKFINTQVDKYDPFVPTGHYVPTTKEIYLNINNRQLKDILRSLCHELIHHHQNISDNRFENLDISGKLNENKDLEILEAEAYQMGNIMFRRWTESKR